MVPGTARQQALLARIVDLYGADLRIRAVCLFGSLARGNWDQYSDLDLDVVVADDVQIDLMAELHALCAAFAPLGERPLIIVPDGDDAGDIVLSSLAELSIRYHSLATTSPNIVDDLRVLASSLDLATIQAAGRANQRPPRIVSGHDVDRVLRWAVEVHIRLERQQFWQAERLLRSMRETLIDLFALSHGDVRSLHGFEDHADASMKAALGATFPDYRLASIRAAQLRMLDLLESDLDAISNGQLRLTEAQREVIAKVRAQ